MLAGLRNALGFGSEKKAQSIENILLEIRNAASGITVTPRNATEVPAVSCAAFRRSPAIFLPSSTIAKRALLQRTTRRIG